MRKTVTRGEEFVRLYKYDEVMLRIKSYKILKRFPSQTFLILFWLFGNQTTKKLKSGKTCDNICRHHIDFRFQHKDFSRFFFTNILIKLPMKRQDRGDQKISTIQKKVELVLKTTGDQLMLRLLEMTFQHRGIAPSKGRLSLLLRKGPLIYRVIFLMFLEFISQLVTEKELVLEET